LAAVATGAAVAIALFAALFAELICCCVQPAQAKIVAIARR
jgi:hypothetical protein